MKKLQTYVQLLDAALQYQLSVGIEELRYYAFRLELTWLKFRKRDK